MRLIFATTMVLVLAACTPQQSLEPVAPATQQTSAPSEQLLEDVRILSADDMEGRMVGSEGGAKARAYLLGRLKEIGIAPAFGDGFEHPFKATRGGKDLTGVNLIGLVKGTGSSDRAMVVMAHYDHVGVKGGEIYNGADDNASGTAAVLAIAAALKQKPPEHDVILALVDAEEGGLSGSRAMVANPAFRPLLDRVALAVNFDMLSRNDRNELYASSAFHFPWLKPYLEGIAGSAPVTLKLGHDDPAMGHDDWTTQSDHMAFHEAGKPWVYFGVEDHADYHRSTDDFSAIPQDFFRRSAQTVELAVRTFDQSLDSMGSDSEKAGR